MRNLDQDSALKIPVSESLESGIELKIELGVCVSTATRRRDEIGTKRVSERQRYRLVGTIRKH